MSAKLMKMTKAELIEKFAIAACESEVNKKKCEKLQTKLDKAEEYIEQARAMIEAIMERWYHYDV